uniref:Uncharacterized protein n=1 Tax=Arundo donax TaxID=35708 RepID=A0A0A8ZLC5_ARUDO
MDKKGDEKLRSAKPLSSLES